MQHFINHAAIERAVAEVFSNERARFYLYGLVALAVTAVGGAALAGVPLRPRFGSARPAARRDPTQPGWATAAKSPASGTAPVATASIARGTASGDCGCRGRRARRNL